MCGVCGGFHPPYGLTDRVLMVVERGMGSHGAPEGAPYLAAACASTRAEQRPQDAGPSRRHCRSNQWRGNGDRPPGRRFVKWAPRSSCVRIWHHKVHRSGVRSPSRGSAMDRLGDRLTGDVVRLNVHPTLPPLALALALAPAPAPRSPPRHSPPPMR